MENQIKRIFIKKNEEGKIEYIAVLRDNGIQKFTKDLNNEFKELLVQINEDVFVDDFKSLKKLRDILINANVILYIDSNFISKIELDKNDIKIYRNFEEEPKILEFDETLDDDELLDEVKKQWEVYKNVLLSQYKLNLSDDLTEEEKEEFTENFNLTESDLEKLGLINQKKVKNLKVNTNAILALFVATALGIGGGYVLGNMEKTKEKENTTNNYVNEYETSTPEPTPYEENVETVVELPEITEHPSDALTPTPVVTPTPTPDVTPTPVVTPASTPVIAETPTVVPTPTITPKLAFTDMDLGITDNVIVLDITPEFITFHYLEDLDYEDSLETLTLLSLEQMSEIGSILQNPKNKPENYSGSLIYFENKFFNSEDIAFVKYFSDIRNEVIYQCSCLEDYERAQMYVTAGNYEVVRCILNNEPIPVEINGQIVPVSYSDLSKDAKEVVFNLAYSLQISMAHEQFEYKDGLVYNQNDMYEVLETIHNNMSFNK